MLHPELEGTNPSVLEPTIGDQLRYRDALQAIAKASDDELHKVVELLAYQAFVVHPAAIRYMVNCAANREPRMDYAAVAAELRAGVLGEKTD